MTLNGNSGQIGIRPSSGKGRMSRATSAPTLGAPDQRQDVRGESITQGSSLARPQSQGDLRRVNGGRRESGGRRPQSQGGVPSRPPIAELPVLPDQRWGSESHDRFILYNTLRCAENEDRLRAEKAKEARDAR